jgi:HSP20 family protein
MTDLQKKMNRLFEEAFSRSVGAEQAEGNLSSGWKPSTDLHEEHDRYVMRADLPGVAAGDVEIKIENGTLFLSGDREADENVSREAYLRVERPHGHFTLEVALSPSVDRSAISAVHRNGVIEIVMPKQKDDEPSKVPIAQK